MSRSVAKLVMESSERNRGPILEVLKKVIPDKFKDQEKISILEIASGSGQHASYFVKEFPQIVWQPSDIEPKHLDSINVYREELNSPNLKSPITVDISKDVSEWQVQPEGPFDMLMASNLVHISPWACTVGLFKAAGSLLRPGGLLFTYGPYALDGHLVPESNVKFDQNLKARNSSWGVRDVRDLETEAKKNDMVFDAMFDMPSNNKSLVFCKI